MMVVKLITAATTVLMLVKVMLMVMIIIFVVIKLYCINRTFQTASSQIEEEKAGKGE